MPNILLVCTANRCRSPMAMVILQRHLEAQGHATDVLGAPTSDSAATISKDQVWRIASAGTWTRNGYPALRETVNTMAELGIELSWHRSREVSAEIINAQDLILVMEAGHREALVQEYPEASGRIHLLAAIAGPAFDISDPVGGSMEDYRNTAHLLDSLLQQGLSTIITKAGQSAPQA